MARDRDEARADALTTLPLGLGGLGHQSWQWRAADYADGAAFGGGVARSFASPEFQLVSSRASVVGDRRCGILLYTGENYVFPSGELTVGEKFRVHAAIKTSLRT